MILSAHTESMILSAHTIILSACASVCTESINSQRALIVNTLSARWKYHAEGDTLSARWEYDTNMNAILSTGRLSVHNKGCWALEVSLHKDNTLSLI